MIEDITYKNITATDLDSSDRTYENCTFIKCDFSYAELANFTFIGCVMDTCNLSMMKVQNTGFQDVRFVDCKITGTNFSICNNFSLSLNFTRCLLSYCLFFKKKLKSTVFTDCKLDEADFSESDLSNSKFIQCDLNRAIFHNTILKSVDFSTAFNFNIDPENNTLTKAKFSAETLAGLLVRHNLVIV